MMHYNRNGMKRQITTGGTLGLTIAMALAGLTAGCRPKEQQDAGPPIVRVSGAEASHDFGYVARETKHLVRFRLHNDKDVPLGIVKVFSDCICIHILEWPESIAPGEAGEVLVEYESSERREIYAGQAIVFTDRRDMPQVLLHVKAVAGLDVEVRPASLAAGQLAPGEQRQLTLDVINHGDAPVRITHGSSDNAACTVSVPQVAIPPNKSATVLADLRGDGPLGERTAIVTIATDSPHQPTVRATIRWTVGQQAAADDSPPEGPGR